MKAVFNNVIIAESDNTVVVEGNHYFPPQSLKKEYFTVSDHKSTCPWKGSASYYSVNVDGKTETDAGWYYKSPSEAAKEIKDHVAFWKGVKVSE
ncbi:DUF427 domain-containing protein [Chryseobacterium indoltheticum]|uniref:Domain of uncharacterized function (DUF427) n=1 Tax=Chryseobacterium indoltheticum TaxID=254 RepID=A0A381FAA4_9FLAO|nr:DUF427 domain-containing protein [Chryseobacterium indoltheticum]AZA73503.1 DUF427 domain-containing protein [Chryseobacterium indoltheticum]SIR00367.1 Nucleotidyltransferase [Chryseobacterium indoltheticum]SUX43394.1 Domain of uncharacterised function (DUF427) [Chryseobacterium indoltheticum]